MKKLRILLTTWLLVLLFAFGGCADKKETTSDVTMASALLGPTFMARGTENHIGEEGSHVVVLLMPTAQRMGLLFLIV